MPLYKIPFILLFTQCYSLALKPPQPPAPKGEQLNSTKLDIPLVGIVRVYGSLYTQWLVAMIEIAAILATEFPSTASSSPIPTATSSGHPGSLRLTYNSALGLFLMAVGALIRQSTFRALGSFFRYQVSIQRNHTLVVNGPYAFVRHPSYTGLVFAVAGWFLWTGASGSWVRESGILATNYGRMAVLFYSVWFMLGHIGVTLGRMSVEDDILRKQFGAEWDNWAKRVPYRVIPGVY